MTTLKDRILLLLNDFPGLTDREITNRLCGRSEIQQPINQACHLLERKGFILRHRHRTSDNFIGNYLVKDSQFIKNAASSSDSSSVKNTILKKYVTKEVIDVEGNEFQKICLILPNRSPTGHIEKFFPQSRYEKVHEKDLHKFGNGPFCKFEIPANLKYPGVYALMIDSEIKYIGECENLSKRYNAMYGNISPAACFTGGRETDCRINNHIYTASTDCREISLWFLNTPRFKETEAQLRQMLRPIWNLV